MAVSLPKGIDYREITNNDDVPFERDPQESTGFGGAVDGVRPTARFASSFHGESKYVQKTLMLDLNETEEGDVARARRLFHQEVNNIHYARHQHVIDITMAYFFQDEEEAYFAIIMPRADGNLHRFMESMTSPGSTKKKLVSQWFGCLANVTEFIHGIGIRHRDVKPENILYKGGNIMFSDFGISKMGLGQTLSTTMPQWMKTATPKHVAPEVGDGSTRGRSADIFSFGTVFLEMFFAHSYPKERPRLKREISGEGGQSYSNRLSRVRTYMDELQMQARTDGEQWKSVMLDLCREMLQEDPEKRPSAERVYSVLSSMPQSGASPGPCGCTRQETLSGAQRLVEACKKRDGLEEVKSLLRNQDANTTGAIHQAAAHGFESIVQSLINENVDINLTDHSGQTPLHYAAGYGHEEVVDLLLRYGAGVDLKDDEGQTPIHCAARQGRLKVLGVLLRQDAQGTSVAIQNIYGQTALHFAARNGNGKVVQILLQRMGPADVAKPDTKRRTALHLAAGYGSEEVVRILLDVLGPESVNTKDENGRKPLHFATRGTKTDGNYLEVVQLLVSRRANHRIYDVQGDSPHFSARQIRPPNIAKVLIADDPNEVEQQPSKVTRPLNPPSHSSDRSYTDVFTEPSNMITESRLRSSITDPSYYAFSKDGDQNNHPGKPSTGADDVDSDLPDTATLYSEASGADTGFIDGYVSEFVNELYSTLRPMTLKREFLNRSSRIEDVLPGLLKNFALRFGHDSQSKERRNIVFYTHRHSK